MAKNKIKLIKFGVAILLAEYLLTQMKNTKKGVDAYFFIKNVVYMLADGDYTHVYTLNGERYTYCETFEMVCSWFPDNFFGSFDRGESINMSLIINHTGKFDYAITIYLPLDWISKVSKNHRRRFLKTIRPEIPIITLTDIERIALAVWNLTGRNFRIENYIFLKK